MEIRDYTNLQSPIPNLQYHLTTVRWRWRQNNEVDSALICKRCQRSYAHRHWDAINRDWIN